MYNYKNLFRLKNAKTDNVAKPRNHRKKLDPVQNLLPDENHTNCDEDDGSQAFKQNATLKTSWDILIEPISRTDKERYREEYKGNEERN